MKKYYPKYYSSLQFKINLVNVDFKLFCRIFVFYYDRFMHFICLIIAYNFIEKYSAKYYSSLQLKLNFVDFNLKLFCCIFTVYYIILCNLFG